jgi:hypothetical protein
MSEVAITEATGVIGRRVCACLSRPATTLWVSVDRRAVEALARSRRVRSLRLREATGGAPSVRGGTDGWSLVLGPRIAA